jgi:hypothetical protein
VVQAQVTFQLSVSQSVSWSVLVSNPLLGPDLKLQFWLLTVCYCSAQPVVLCVSHDTWLIGVQILRLVCFLSFVFWRLRYLLYRAWRQKIEAWLQENEKEEKQNEELRRRSRRVQSSRRSLEADSGKWRSSTVFTCCSVHWWKQT